MIEEIQGDVFKAKEDILIHGCNCFNTMGSGVAKIVKALYLGAWIHDQNTLRGDKTKLGDYTYWFGPHYYHDQNITVINLYSQYRYGRSGDVYANYDAIAKGLMTIKDDFPNKSIAMPRIGAGLAGGDWETIKLIIRLVFDEDSIVKIYYL